MYKNTTYTFKMYLYWLRAGIINFGKDFIVINCFSTKWLFDLWAPCAKSYAFLFTTVGWHTVLLALSPIAVTMLHLSMGGKEAKGSSRFINHLRFINLSRFMNLSYRDSNWLIHFKDFFRFMNLNQNNPTLVATRQHDILVLKMTDKVQCI